MMFSLIVTDDLLYHNQVQLIEVFSLVRIFARSQPGTGFRMVNKVVQRIPETNGLTCTSAKQDDLLLERSIIARFDGLFIRERFANDISAWTRVIIILRKNRSLPTELQQLYCSKTTIRTWIQIDVLKNQTTPSASCRSPRNPLNLDPLVRLVSLMALRHMVMMFPAFWRTVSASPW